MTKPRTRPRTNAGVTFAEVRALALALPGVEEGTSYGTPAFKVSGKLFARMHQDGESLVLRVDLDARDGLLRSDPRMFFLTDHYLAYPYVLVHLAQAKPAKLAALLEEARRSVAPKRLVAGGRPARAPTAGQRPKKPPAGAPLDALSRLRAICLALPEVTEIESHGHPCFKVRGKAFAMFLHNHHGDGRVALWCNAEPGVQEVIVASDPARFFVPPYVGPRGWIGARLEAGADWALIATCVEDSYRLSSSKRAAARGKRKTATLAS